MNQQLIIPIAAKLCHPLYYGSGEQLPIDKEWLTSLHLQPLFLYEAAFYAGVKTLRPWERKEECIPLLLEEWREQKNALEAHFAVRNQKAAQEPMKIAIAIFLKLLFWTNGQPVDFRAEPQELQIHPVNLKERLEFICKRPASYHAYVQLSELMAEMEKQYVKYLALEKLKKK